MQLQLQLLGAALQKAGVASVRLPAQELMADPVMVATGHTYDRVCIERWLAQGNRTCPVTGMRLRHLELTPNFALRNAIQVRCRFLAHSVSVDGLATRRRSSCQWCSGVLTQASVARAGVGFAE